MIRAVDMGSTFALARYAAEKVKPLVDQIPGGSLGVEVNLDDKWMRKPWHVYVAVHRVVVVGGANRLAPVVFQKSLLVTTDDVDRAVEELKLTVNHRAWKLHESEKADSEMGEA